MGGGTGSGFKTAWLKVLAQNLLWITFGIAVISLLAGAAWVGISHGKLWSICFGIISGLGALLLIYGFGLFITDLIRIYRPAILERRS